MNLLCISHRIPFPPNKGDKIRGFHLIKGLAKRHKVHLLCFIDAPEDISHVNGLERYCASVETTYRHKVNSIMSMVLGLIAGRPLSVAAFRDKEFAKKVDRKLATEEIDVVLVSSSAVAQYAEGVADAAKVIDFVDVDSEKWNAYAERQPLPWSWIYGLESKRLSQYEEQLADVFDASVFVSNAERQVFRHRVEDECALSVVPNGVDIEYFMPTERLRQDCFGPTICFIGAMDYFPNVDAVSFFCDEILATVRAKTPTVQFTIVGRNPSPTVKQLEKRPGVVVTGSVPDVRPYLARADVAVAPFRIARGVQNKVLEAMAAGIPVVGTSKAFEGLDVTENDGIIVADQPGQFAAAVVGLLNEDFQRRRHFGLLARRYVEKNHRWEDQIEKMDRILHGARWGQERAKAPGGVLQRS